MKPLILFSFLASLSAAQADPLVTSWYTGISSKYARIYSSTGNRTSGSSASTWSGTQSQTTPAYAGVNEVNSSANWVYIRTSGLAAHVMGAMEQSEPAEEPCPRLAFSARAHGSWYQPCLHRPHQHGCHRFPGGRCGVTIPTVP